MASSDISAALDHAEICLDALGEALRTGDTAELEQAGARMREASLLVSRVLESQGRPAAADKAAQKTLRERASRVARLLGLLREQMARRASFIDRSLATVLPQAGGDPTYASASPVRGAFGARGGVARIYANRF